MQPKSQFYLHHLNIKYTLMPVVGPKDSEELDDMQLRVCEFTVFLFSVSVTSWTIACKKEELREVDNIHQ